MSAPSFSVEFYGVRGSIPTPLTSPEMRQKLTYALKEADGVDLSTDENISNFIDSLPQHIKGIIGGNTCCLHIRCGEDHLIIDAGSGLFNLAKTFFKEGFGSGKGKANWLITHTHMDHVVGLPMFGPIYIPGNEFNFYSPLADLKDRFTALMDPTLFPVNFSDLPSNIQFNDISDTKSFELGDMKISWLENDHPGRSFSYRIECGGKVIVLSTDAEYKDLRPERLNPVIEFFKDADVLIFDAQYAFTESVELKRDWGHSSSFVGIDLALDANVKKLSLFHHEPNYGDFQLASNLSQARSYLKNLEPGARLEIELAYEGLVYDFSPNRDS